MIRAAGKAALDEGNVEDGAVEVDKLEEVTLQGQGVIIVSLGPAMLKVAFKVTNPITINGGNIINNIIKAKPKTVQKGKNGSLPAMASEEVSWLASNRGLDCETDCRRIVCTTPL